MLYTIHGHCNTRGQVKIGNYVYSCLQVTYFFFLNSRKVAHIYYRLTEYRHWLNIVWVTAVKTQDKKFPIVASLRGPGGPRDSDGDWKYFTAASPSHTSGRGQFVGRREGGAGQINQNNMRQISPLNTFPKNYADTLSSDWKSFI